MDRISYRFAPRTHETPEALENQKTKEAELRKKAAEKQKMELEFFIVTEIGDKIELRPWTVTTNYNSSNETYELMSEFYPKSTVEFCEPSKYSHMYQVNNSENFIKRNDQIIAFTTPKLLRLYKNPTSALNLQKLVDLTNLTKQQMLEASITVSKSFYPAYIVNPAVFMIGLTHMRLQDLEIKNCLKDFTGENDFVTNVDTLHVSGLTVLIHYNLNMEAHLARIHALTAEDKPVPSKVKKVRLFFQYLEDCSNWYETQFKSIIKKEYGELDFMDPLKTLKELDFMDPLKTLKKITDLDWRTFSDKLMRNFCDLNIEYITRFIHIHEVGLIKLSDVEHYDTDEDEREANANGLLLQWPNPLMQFDHQPKVQEVEHQYLNMNKNVWKDLIYPVTPETMPWTFKNPQTPYVDTKEFVASIRRKLIHSNYCLENMLENMQKGPKYSEIERLYDKHFKNVDITKIEKSEETIQRFYLYLYLVQNTLDVLPWV